MLSVCLFLVFFVHRGVGSVDHDVVCRVWGGVREHFESDMRTIHCVMYVAKGREAVGLSMH